jgi:hypothetical protein
MQENGCRCQMMMAMAMKGSVYIIIGKEQIKHKRHEKISINNSIGIKLGTYWSLGSEQ